MINPSSMSYERYASELSIELQRVGINAAVPYPWSEDEWKRWARGIVSIPALARYTIPSPEGYVSWRDWAFAFTRAFTAT